MLPPDELDAILTFQLAVAWAGESGDDEPRLRWWETDLVSKYGGLSLFEQLTPRSRHWAVLEAAREAARRVDEKARSKDAEPDHVASGGIQFFGAGPHQIEPGGYVLSLQGTTYQNPKITACLSYN